MTIEEKALAYDEALRKIRPLYERAKKEDCPIWSTYEYVFPELREGQENDVIDIPFGAKDFELKYREYTIPEGFTAEIKGGKVIVKEKESEDEKVIDELNLLKEIQDYYKKNWAGLYITFAMYKRIARYFYFLGKNEKR